MPCGTWPLCDTKNIETNGTANWYETRLIEQGDSPMNEKGKNIIPMIGFILIVAVLMGGFALAKGFGKDGIFSSNTERSKSEAKGSALGGYNIDETGNMTASGMDKISISSISSEVNIDTHSSNEVEAHFHGKITTLSKDALPYLEVKKEGKTVIVRIVYPITTNISISGQTWLDVKVPENWADDLEVSTVSGSINAPELNGEEIKLKTTSGEIKVENISGETVQMHSTSGSFKIGKLDAQETFEKNTVSGSFEADSIEADEVKLGSTSGSTTVRDAVIEKVTSTSISGTVQMNIQEGSAEMSTTSGEISVSFEQGFEEFKANSVSGSVKLQIPGDSGFKIDVNTVSGDINCEDFSMKIISSKKNHLEAEAGDGDSRIEVHTTSGSVNIQKR